MSLIIIEQTAKPLVPGTNVEVNIHDSAGGALLRTSSSELKTHDTDLLTAVTATNTKIDTVNTNLGTINTSITASNTKLDTLHADNLVIEGKQDAQTAQLTSILAALTAVLVDTFGTKACPASWAAIIASTPCKYVTLWSLSTDANIELRISGGTSVILEPGYSLRINTANANNIDCQQTGAEADTLYFAITA